MGFFEKIKARTDQDPAGSSRHLQRVHRRRDDDDFYDDLRRA